MGHVAKYIDSDLTNGGLTSDQMESFEDVNTNSTESATDWVDVSSCEFLAIYIKGVTGSHDVHEVVLEMSPNGTFNGGPHMHEMMVMKITGAGHMHFHDIESMAYVRMSVLKAEGSESTCKFFMQAFRDS